LDFHYVKVTIDRSAGSLNYNLDPNLPILSRFNGSWAAELYGRVLKDGLGVARVVVISGKPD
jgi:hypothetical protein